MNLSRFTASKGWLENFLIRNKLSLRRITSTGRALPRNTPIIVTDHLRKMEKLGRIYSKSEILNMDETNIQLDYPSSYTYDKIGTPNINATTSGGERTKISLAFTASSNGRKFPILSSIVIPRKNPLKAPFKCPDSVVILYKPKSKTFDTNIMKGSFLQNIIRPYMLRHNKSRVLLHLDNSPVHKRSDLLSAFKQNGVEVSYFPARMTSLLQPADVGWFRSLKAQYHSKWQEWYLSSPKSFTTASNLKSPGYAKVINWISEI